PMPAERVRALETLATGSPYWSKQDSPALQARHDLMRAKLFGYMDRPDTVARRYPFSDTSLPARYARAIASYRFSNNGNAFASIAMAYGRKGDLARADLASAQSAFMRGDLKTARQLATRAKTHFAVGSPGWVKADDIATYRPKGKPLSAN